MNVLKISFIILIQAHFLALLPVGYKAVYRVYQKKVDKSETALYFVKRFNVRTFLLK